MHLYMIWPIYDVGKQSRSLIRPCKLKGAFTGDQQNAIKQQ
jgi:hypothetical protein